ncbi:hypothetical protein MMC29_002697 [Sticta canariensis]|nr:hypothetical protein [Sticta canariensis]
MAFTTPFLSLEAPMYDLQSDTWSIGNVVQGYKPCVVSRLAHRPLARSELFGGAGEERSKDLDRAIYALMRSNHRERAPLAKFAPDLARMRHQFPEGKGVNSHEAKNAAKKPWAVSS